MRSFECAHPSSLPEVGLPPSHRRADECLARKPGVAEGENGEMRSRCQKDGGG